MKEAGQTVDTFNARQATLYVGLQLEEMAEKLGVISGGAVSMADRHLLSSTASALRQLSDRFKVGFHMGDVLRSRRDALLDADIDLAWASLGAAFSTSSDTYGAIAEVARANLDKFVDGKALRDKQGKVMKPAGWRPPNLEPFVVPPCD